MLAPAVILTALVAVLGFTLDSDDDPASGDQAGVPTVAPTPVVTPSATPTPSESSSSKPEASGAKKKLVGPTLTIKRKPKPKSRTIDSFSFTLASFNLLGHSHTVNGGRGLPPSVVRTPLAVNALRNNSVDLVGLQEFQAPQMARFMALAGGEYGVYPPASAGVMMHANAVAWRKDTFTLVEQRTFGIPYFFGQTRQMPVVQLEHNATGQRLWLLNVHNPANAHGNAAHWRSQATQIEVNLINQLSAEDENVPVFFTGDLNDWEGVFCKVTTSTSVKAANGGSTGSPCAPPPRPLAVDWVFGSDFVSFSNYRALRTPEIRRATDHPLVATEVTVPSFKEKIIYKDGKPVG